VGGEHPQHRPRRLDGRPGQRFQRGDIEWLGRQFDAELTEVSDDTPSFGRVAITCHKAQALVQYSIESEQDIATLGQELFKILADAKGDLEASKFALGSGVAEPAGIWTQLDSNTNVEMQSTTAATLGLADIHSLYQAVPIRHRRLGTFLMNPTYSLALKALGATVGASYTNDLTRAPSSHILGRPLVEDDDAPATQTTTVRDNEIIFGNFEQFVIADVAGMSVEPIPHMLGSNRRPDGTRALYAHWRVGSGSTNDLAFRLLQDRTSA
jgi:HK97 family phage major capsid protein